MVDYVIINSTATELTDVNAGGDDVAAYTISADITLSDAELAVVATLNGVAVMQASASAAEKLAVGDLLVGGTGAAPGDALVKVTASTFAIAAATLTPSAAKTLLLADDTCLIGDGMTTENRRKVARLLTHGGDPSTWTTASGV